MNKVPFNITRINNASVLINIGEHNILTDPYFIHVPFLGIKEKAAIKPEELPPLTAILGCHDAKDHWQMDGLADYPHNKDEVQVFVAMEAQAKEAKKFGFKNAEVLPWGEKRMLGDLSIESVEGQKVLRWTVNNYAIRVGDTTVFYGGEARDLPPLKRYYDNNGAVDVTIFPVNAVHFLSFFKLVMSGPEAVEGAKILGSKFMMAIHDSHTHYPLLMPIKSSGLEAEKAAINDDSIEVIRIPTGVLWSSDNQVTLHGDASMT